MFGSSLIPAPRGPSFARAPDHPGNARAADHYFQPNRAALRVRVELRVLNGIPLPAPAPACGRPLTSASFLLVRFTAFSETLRGTVAVQVSSAATFKSMRIRAHGTAV